MIARHRFIVALLTGWAACRSPSRPSQVEAAPLDATLHKDCSVQLSAFREHLIAAPMEHVWMRMNKNVPPPTTARLVMIGAQYRPLVTVWRADIAWRGQSTPIDDFDADRFMTSVERFYEKVDEPLLYVQVDAEAPLIAIRAVRDALATVETRMHRTFIVGLLFQAAPESFTPYEVPVPMPTWAREEVSEFRRTERYQHMVPEFAGRALRRAAPDCHAASAAGAAVADLSDHDAKLEAALIDALAACDCSQVDLDAFAGLVLGAIGYRNPYGYVRLATSPKAKHRIKVSLAATMSYLATAWPTDASAEAVWVDFE